MFFPSRAEFSRSHEDDIGNIGKSVEGITVEQVTGDGFDPLRSEGGGQLAIAESGYRDHPLLDACLVDGASRKTDQAWAHFAARAEDEKIAVKSSHRPGGFFVRE
jgi:hypothetical protein